MRRADPAGCRAWFQRTLQGAIPVPPFSRGHEERHSHGIVGTRRRQAAMVRPEGVADGMLTPASLKTQRRQDRSGIRTPQHPCPPLIRLCKTHSRNPHPIQVHAPAKFLQPGLIKRWSGLSIRTKAWVSVPNRSLSAETNPPSLNIVTGRTLKLPPQGTGWRRPRRRSKAIPNAMRTSPPRILSKRGQSRDAPSQQPHETLLHRQRRRLERHHA